MIAKDNARVSVILANGQEVIHIDNVQMELTIRRSTVTDRVVRD